VRLVDDATAAWPRPIDPRYAGFRFHSRLEAQWAVFFDALGISWRYKPQGYKLPDGTQCLPDFEMVHDDMFTARPANPRQVTCAGKEVFDRTFIVIKGTHWELEEFDKMYDLSQSMCCEVVLLMGTPSDVLRLDNVRSISFFDGIDYVTWAGRLYPTDLLHDAMDAAMDARFEAGEQ
jgi:hypothetical protein